MIRQQLKRFFTLLNVLLLIGLTSSVVYAQSIDTPSNQGDQTTPLTPTPLKNIAPKGNQLIPEATPLYDKGVTITEIEIVGNKDVPAESILKAISTQPGSLYSKTRLQKDLKKIYDMGYFTDHMKVVPIATREGIHLRFELEENAIVKSIDFKGNTIFTSDELGKIFTGQVGMPENVNQINSGIQAVEKKYKDKGYILARVQDIKEDPPGTITFVMSEGKIANISFSGNKKTKDYVIRRAMVEKEGNIYNEKTVGEDMKRIFSTQLFSDVRRVVKASPESASEYDLVIEVDEKKTGAISLGGGLDTGTGLFGSVGYNDPNFLGRGDSVSTIFSLGTGILWSTSDVLRRAVFQFETNWSAPSFLETNNALGTSLYARQLASFNIPLTVEQRYGGEIDWSRPLEAHPGANVSMGLGYEKTNVKEGVTQDQLALYGVTPAERAKELKDGSYTFLEPGFSYDSRNNRLNPTEGWLNTFGSHLALGLTNSSYGTLSANLRRYLKVTDNITFAVNAQGGVKGFGNVPQFNMFRLGGAYTVRGFEEGGLGIGQDYLLGSAEIRTKLPFLKFFDKFPLYDILQAAFFTDAGVLYEEPSSNHLFSRPGYGVSIGAGLRVNIPAVGPMRVDWAQPITGARGGHTQHFNFGVGNKF